MAKNVGKVFESDFSSSLPSYCMYHRLKDSAQSYNKTAKFTTKNPFDCMVLDDRHGLLYAAELKSTKYKSMSFATDKDDDNKMIKYHQLEALRERAKYKHVVPCLILNFRDDDTNLQRTYFMHINDFDKFASSTEKKSINELDILTNQGLKVNGSLKRTRYAWNIEELFEKVANQLNK